MAVAVWVDHPGIVWERPVCPGDPQQSEGHTEGAGTKCGLFVTGAQELRGCTLALILNLILILTLTPVLTLMSILTLNLFLTPVLTLAPSLNLIPTLILTLTPS